MLSYSFDRLETTSLLPSNCHKWKVNLDNYCLA